MGRARCSASPAYDTPGSTGISAWPLSVPGEAGEATGAGGSLPCDMIGLLIGVCSRYASAAGLVSTFSAGTWFNGPSGDPVGIELAGCDRYRSHWEATGLGGPILYPSVLCISRRNGLAALPNGIPGSNGTCIDGTVSTGCSCCCCCYCCCCWCCCCRNTTRSCI